MASYYSTSVTKPQLGLEAVPEDAASRPHHVKKRNGNTSKFRNIHPSAGELFAVWPFFKLVVAYVGLVKVPFAPDVNNCSGPRLPVTWSRPILHRQQ